MTVARDGLFPQNVLVVYGPSSLPLWLVVITKKGLSGVWSTMHIPSSDTENNLIFRTELRPHNKRRSGRRLAKLNLSCM